MTWPPAIFHRWRRAVEAQRAHDRLDLLDTIHAALGAGYRETRRDLLAVVAGQGVADFWAGTMEAAEQAAAARGR